MSLQNKVYKFALLGNPVSKSLSPLLFKIFGKLLNIKIRYDLILCDESSLSSELNSLKEKNYDGVNITMPHKQNIIKLVDNVLDTARISGTVNCIKLNSKKNIATNTDVLAMQDLLNKNQINPKDKTAFIYGAGGAARASVYTLCSGKIKKIFLCSRRKEQADDLIHYFENICGGTELVYTDNFKENADIYINATPVGMYNDDIVEWPYSQNKIYVDWGYKKSDTGIIKHAKKVNARNIGGNNLLLRQAILTLLFCAENIDFNLEDFESKAERIFIKAISEK